MPRDIRFIPPRSLQHVVDNTFQGRYLLAPSEQVNDLVAGVLGRAQRLYEMEICAVVVVSNHVHLLLRPEDAAHLSAFMGFFKTNVAKEIGRRLRHWNGRFFEGRYRSITVSSEPMTQAAVLRYILSHGPKEGLVDRVLDWPGIHSAKHLIKGRPIIGHWHDRTQERTRKHRTLDSGGTRELVSLSPLPAFRHLSESQWRQFVKGMVQEIDLEWAAHRRLMGTRTLGVKQVLSMDPEFRPADRKRAPKRRFHASRQVLAALKELWLRVITAFKEASTELRGGNKTAVFPEGTFPPGGAFIPFTSQTLLETRGRPWLQAFVHGVQ